METIFTVYVGKHKLSDDPSGTAEHWAIGLKYDGVIHWYEIEGASKRDRGAKNKINIHTNSEKYSVQEFCCEKKYSDSKPFEQFLKEWHDKWVEEHPIYSINGDNCQMHVKEFLRFIGHEDDVITQNNKIGNMVIGAGIGAGVVAVFAIVTGLLIKGKH